MKRNLVCIGLFFAISILNAQTIYVDALKGDDSNIGNKIAPLKTLYKAAEIANSSTGHLSTEIIIKEGIYVIDSTIIFKPSIDYSTIDRFTIRSEVLPDEPHWTPSKMPVILPLLLDLKDDPEGKWSNGLQIDVSHATIQGLKIMGSPIHEYINENKIIRAYPIARVEGDLEDLLITQCLFVGNEQILPLHMAVYAEGNKVVVDHCVFYNCKIGVLFANYSQEETFGNAVTNNLFIGLDGTAMWIMNTSTDFIIKGNSIVNSNYAIILESGNDRRYKIENSLFANVIGMVGNGAGPLLNFSSLDKSVIDIGTGVKFSNEIIEINYDQSQNDFLHIVTNDSTGNYHSGLFKKY